MLGTNGRELVMTTDPLDVESVMSAADGPAWNGMRPGTTMGHVHPSVGSLDAAERFHHHALGFDKTVWNYPGALFLAAGGYHHHLGTNTWSAAPSPAPEQAQLLEWALVVPSPDDAAHVARRLRSAGYPSEETVDGVTAADPWGTRVHIRASAQDRR
jgi:catechol 2,3-dioxygenase